VLFLDIVGSTAVASELGDGRWRAVLSRFRSVVRRELKRFDGHEQGTAGDGFFATFDGPDQALRGAAAITVAVQELGLDVRTGIHVGECEEIEGELGGIAVHIAARVMALAGPAEVLVTGTTKDLVTGSGATFEQRGSGELKGVEGSWPIWALRTIEVELPPPLAPEVAAERLSDAATEARRRRWRLLAAAVAVLVLAAAAAVGIAVAVGGGAGRPPTLVSLDPGSGRVVAAVHDRVLGCACGAELWAIGGTLWERTGTVGQAIASRALGNGALQRSIALPPGSTGLAIGYGGVWALRPCTVIGSARPSCTVDRYDELSGRIVASIQVHADLGNGAIAVGDGAVWVLDRDGGLTRIDPATNRAAAPLDTGAIETFALAIGGPYAWVCECFSRNDVLRYDPRTHTVMRIALVHPVPIFTPTTTTAPPTTTRPKHAAHHVSRYVARTWLIGVDNRSGLIWIMSPSGATLGGWDAVTGKPAAPLLGLAGEPSQAVLAHGTIWVAAGTVVDRISLASGKKETIRLPKGMNAAGIAVDPLTGQVWVASGAAPAT
jgi:hypothetical protein